MQKIGFWIIGGCISVQSALGGPLEQDQVARDAKWLAHVDMERLMQTPFGEMAVTRLKEEIARNNESMVSVDIDLVLAELKSITAYGTQIGEESASDAVMVLETGDKLQSVIDGFLAHQELMSEDEVSFQRLEDKPFDTYLFEEELYVSYPRVGLVIASKNFKQIENAFAVLEGNAENLSASKDALVLNQRDDFFLLATATGLDQLKNVPPQARILQKTKGGQLSFGDADGALTANLILATSGREVSLQLQRILQGMVALASFTQVENQNIMEIVNRVEVKQGDDWVSVDISYPMDNLMKLLREAMAPSTEATQNETGPNDQSRHDGRADNEACETMYASCAAGLAEGLALAWTSHE